LPAHGPNIASIKIVQARLPVLPSAGWARKFGPKLHSNETAARKQELLLRAAG